MRFWRARRKEEGGGEGVKLAVSGAELDVDVGWFCAVVHRL